MEMLMGTEKNKSGMGTKIHRPESPVAPRQEPDEEQRPSAPVPSDKTPQEFYAEITKREDVRAILKALASA
jgi:hypothetical protein